MKINKLIIEVNKPIAEFFAFCITPPKANLWVPGIINETTNEWPAKTGTIYSEFKDDNTSFNIIVTDFKENEYIEWKTDDDSYYVRYTFTLVDQNKTKLEYVESGIVDEPFTQKVMEKLKEAAEKDQSQK